MPGPLMTNDITALALKLDEVAHMLGVCALRHVGTVNSYEAARAEAQRWNAGGADR